MTDKLKPITDEKLRQITVNHLGEVKFNGANNCADIAATVNTMLARIRADAAEIKRLKNLLGRYSDHVGDEEGVDFLDQVWSGSLISEKEADEIKSYSGVLNNENS